MLGGRLANAYIWESIGMCVVLHLTQNVPGDGQILCHSLRFPSLEIRSNDNSSVPSTPGEDQCLMAELGTLKAHQPLQTGTWAWRYPTASPVRVLWLAQGYRGGVCSDLQGTFLHTEGNTLSASSLLICILPI